MPARIVSIGTALPATAVTQGDLRDFFAAQPGADKLTRRLISGAFDASGIETRHTVLSALQRSPRAAGEPEGAFVSDEGALLSPTTAVLHSSSSAATESPAARAVTTRVGPG